MAKRRSASSQQRTLIGSILGAIVLIIAVVMSQCTGTETPPPPPTSTSVPITQVVTVTPVLTTPGSVTPITMHQGFGAQKGFWQVYFTAPTGSRDPRTYVGGIDAVLVNAINSVQSTLDIAAYEFNLASLTQAVLNARQRGVQVRVVTDDEDGLSDEETTLNQLVNAGIPVVSDERSALMHNKFMILDGTTVWTGSWNYTINDTYRNNNNALVLRSRQVVQNYQAEFNEMFVDGRFGPTSPVNTPNQQFTQDGIPISTYFASEGDVIDAMNATLSGAQRSIRFMAFSFTVDDVGQTLIARANNGVSVQGIFETTGSETQFSELRPLLCAGLQVRQDGNSFILHHKVFIIDDTTVITGSFNISDNATGSNDENLVIISDPDLAAQYTTEFNRRWAEARTPTGITCQ
jgi:phosphatidylserine/phosphatidylglycerophosphate/cardiolipin synthase-like enzyme